jgi:hypothetical protein
MSTPELYHQYDRQQAIAFFGREDEGTALCAGQWVVLPDTVLCFATVGDPPGGSYFFPASRFHWVADRPYQAAEAEMPFLPLEVRGQRDKDRPIFLFVGLSGPNSFTYVGQTSPCYSYGVDRFHPFGIAYFELSKSLPSRVWSTLGGPDAVEADHAALDAALEHLGRNPSVQERLVILRQVAEYWHGPLGPGDSLTPGELEGKPLPVPLRRWFELAGRRTEILSWQNQLLGPDELKPVDDGRLLFYVENEGVYLWSTDPAGNDPPVWGRFNEPGEPWTPEGMTLSEFLIGVCLFEAIIQAPYGATAAWADQEVLKKLTAVLHPLSLVPWRWPAYPSQFYGRNGAFAFVCPNDDCQGQEALSIWVGAKTDQPIAFLRTIVDDRWEHTALG